MYRTLTIKIRKWAYHLIIYENTSKLISRCIKNLTDEIEKDIENIIWIMAIASISLDDMDLYKKYVEGIIIQSQYRIRTSVFSYKWYEYQ